MLEVADSNYLSMQRENRKVREVLCSSRWSTDWLVCPACSEVGTGFDNATPINLVAERSLLGPSESRVVPNSVQWGRS